MHRQIHQWWSPRLNKNMEIAVYGHYGFSLLLFPTAAADYLEYERFELMAAIAPLVDSGKCRVFSINSINNESWLNRQMNPRHKAIRHQQYNGYITEEVVPFIKNYSSWETPILTAGASLGAFHAMNTFCRRPDLFAGTIAMSGVYDLTDYTDDYFDEDVFFNSPHHYLPNWNDEQMLSYMRRSSIIVASGQGDYESPEGSRNISRILHSKGIPHWLDLWGYDVKHDWPTWREMLPYFLSKI
jgi:esterase/lipase superfamily enzyme